MSYFKLDVSSIKNSILDYNESKKLYMDNIELIYNSLSSFDSSWKDANSDVFVKRISLDKNNVVEYLNSIDLLYNKISFFVDDIQTIINRRGYDSNLKKIKFNDNVSEKIKSKLNNIIYYLNNSLYQINNYIISSDFSDMSLIYDLRSQIINSISIVNSILSNIDKYINDVLSILNDNIIEISKLEKVELKLDKIDYTPRIIDLSQVE